MFTRCHHGELVWCIGIGRTFRFAPFVAVVERGFVAMVTISDDQLLVGHLLLNGLENLRN